MPQYCMDLLIRSLVVVVMLAAALAGCNAEAPRSDPIEVITGGTEVDISKHLAAGKITLVEFYAEWCGPCKMIAPILDELADEYSGRVHIGKVNIEDHQNLATEYGVRAIPTLLLFQNGQVAEQIVGLRSKRDLKASFDKVAV